ncbi:glycosyl hydrolase family 28-related protein [Parafilimonas terrae]|uniref:SMP-30/Gluconolaconase/LRE-like region-containing protein n=1 Tax=Parafilimonas terrae TaxID=1465490 RepID=A0A1I5ZC96_9BACT|nr:glycosyl hydrolase family 28-related protein [Parafilimonas terrae]SFQ54043.1 SMP-30/Gluconolaconase/LRE-like region-containing protein [Parafilimonas terrae]
MKIIAATFLAFLFCINYSQAQKNTTPKSKSFYTKQLMDSDAVYFTPENFNIKADGSMDVSDVLQQALYELKTTHNFGILFLPEGKYLISKTIYVPQAIRIIGYGANRPLIVLKKNSPGFNEIDSSDKGNAKYMFWFIHSVPRPGHKPGDAGAGTFYSAMSNVDLEIENGNPYAVALRTHYAQHSFIAHVDIHINNGFAGMFDVGNEMEDVKFFGGEYGIYTTKPSPGWQFMMVDTYFEGQRKAAIKTQEAGLTIVRMQAKNVPSVIDINPNYIEKLFMEDCRFENVKQQAILVSLPDNAGNQISLKNIDCSNVPVLVNYRDDTKKVEGKGKVYKVKAFMQGLQMDSLHADPVVKTIAEMEALKTLPAPAQKDIPDFPAIDSWVNLKTLGAVGDGVTDDTKAIQDAIDKYETIYVPQGWYRVSETIKLKPNTALIGLTPIGTQFILAESTPAFSGFGAPKPLLESSKGGNNIVTGIGLTTGFANYRAVACKWMAGEHSYMNDVKFIGGHGTMQWIWKHKSEEKDIYGDNLVNGFDPLWATQYWSLWITDGGGGTFKNIWTANTWATNGAYISNTSTPGRIYAMSIEHHVHNEIRFSNVSNFKVYALQLEEESRESSECQPMELEHCKNMVFANLYMFRVIRVNVPYPYSIRNFGSSNIEFLNVHNYSQIKYTTSNPLYDVNSNTTVRPWEFNRLYIDKATSVVTNNNEVNQLATGFEFAEGICRDSKNNIYFCDSRMKRIYKYDASSKQTTLLADYPWEPLSLACDKNDNLLVVFKYNPQKGYIVNGKQEAFTNPPDARGTSFSGWGNSGFATWVYSVNPSNPDETIHLLDTVKMSSVQNVYKALYPGHRWRDYHDFNTVTVNRPEECFIAPDGVTIIPKVYDLARASCLSEAFPNKPAYVTDEYDKRTVKLDVDAQGYVSNLKYFAEKGEFGTAEDDKGNVYIADGEIYVYDAQGKFIKEIKTPERPTSVVISDDGNIIYYTSAGSLFSKI